MTSYLIRASHAAICACCPLSCHCISKHSLCLFHTLLLRSSTPPRCPLSLHKTPVFLILALVHQCLFARETQNLPQNLQCSSSRRNNSGIHICIHEQLQLCCTNSSWVSGAPAEKQNSENFSAGSPLTDFKHSLFSHLAIFKGSLIHGHSFRACLHFWKAS